MNRTKMPETKSKAKSMNRTKMPETKTGMTTGMKMDPMPMRQR